ncbi:MAG: indole-3-glycerol-phosphate synthase [Myxococcota bacterium]
MDYLGQILERKGVEVRRRASYVRARPGALEDPSPGERGARAIQCLRRGDASLPRVIAEVKFRSPSAGVIRERRPGEGARIARAYEEGGAAAISVLADGPGFGGSVLEVRRVARAVSVPVLFKEFVLDPVQVRFARAAGASLVLLLVRVLSDRRLRELISVVREQGMEPVVEAADAAEVDRALETDATVVGVNARDLKSFRVDGKAAARCLQVVPEGRVAVYMSGVRAAEDLRALAPTRADAVLVGEALMRAGDPRAQLERWLGGA